MGDRNTYRMYEDGRLIEEAIYNPNAELAIALGERLQDVLVCTEAEVDEAKSRAKDFEIDCNKLDDKVYELQQKIDMFEMALDQRDRVIESLEKHIEQLKKDN